MGATPLLFICAALAARCASQPQLVTTFAGGGASGGASGAADGAGTAALFASPGDATFSPDGLVYVSDTNNNLLRAIAPDGTTLTIAGQGANSPGSADGTGGAAALDGPFSGAAVGGGFLFSDVYNNKVRFCMPVNSSACKVTTIAGGGDSGRQSGAVDGNERFALFAAPRGIAVDASGNAYVADSGNNKIRLFPPPDGNGYTWVSTVAGGGGPNGSASGSTDGTASDALFDNPYAVALGPTGLYIADSGNNKIRVMSIVVSTLAGGGIDGMQGGYYDGLGTSALFNAPAGLAYFEDAEILYVADVGNNCVRAVTPAGAVTTLAGGGGASWGGGRAGNANGYGTAALFNSPTGISIGRGLLFVADSANSEIRTVALPTPLVSATPLMSATPSMSLTLSATMSATPSAMPPPSPPAGAGFSVTLGAPALAGIGGALALTVVAFALGLRFGAARVRAARPSRSVNEVEVPMLYADGARE